MYENACNRASAALLLRNVLLIEALRDARTFGQWLRLGIQTTCLFKTEKESTIGKVVILY